MANNSLSKKDKSLIYLCILLAIGAAAYIFGISPIMDKRDKLQKKLTSVSAKADKASSDALMYDIIVESSLDSKSAYENIRKNFKDSLLPENADDYLTKGLQDCGISPENMSFSVSESSGEDGIEIAPYNYVVEESETELIPITIVKEFNVEVTCSGNMDSIRKYMEFLNETDGLYISDVSLTPSTTNIAENELLTAAPDLTKGNPAVEADISAVYYIYDSKYYENLIAEQNQNTVSEETDGEAVDGDTVDGETGE